MNYNSGDQFFKKALERLNERAKELNCLYHIEEILHIENQSLEHLFGKIIETIPPGWQYPTICEVRIVFEGKNFQSADFKETEWTQRADIIVDNNMAGFVEVVYTQLIKLVNNSQFLAEEQKLLNSIAHTISDHIFSRRVKSSIEMLQASWHEENEMTEPILGPTSDEHWKWRFRMAQLIASRLDSTRFGVKAVYLLGSVKNATSGPGSDIDLMIHFVGSAEQKLQLLAWFEGWSLCLAEMNFMKTGYRTDQLLDIHIKTDEDILQKDSFTVKINAVNDPARLLPMMLKKSL